MFPESAAEPPPVPGLLRTAALAGLLGMAVGAVFGLGQSLALPRGIRRLPWIAANEAGWAVGLPAIYVAAQIAGGLQGWTDRIVVWAAGGFLAGASIGITTGVALVFHARARARRDG